MSSFIFYGYGLQMMRKSVTGQRQGLPLALFAGLLSVLVAFSMAVTNAYAQNASPSFQYVAAAEGELRGSSTNYTAHPGSRQFLYFSNDKLTIAAIIEVQEIRSGTARLKVRAKSFPGPVERSTSERELSSVPAREYTYVPLEKMSMPVDGGGLLSLIGAIADQAGNLSKPFAPHSVEAERGQIVLMSPALLRGDRVLLNLKDGAATGTALRGNPAIALYASSDGLFIFALQQFDGATPCEVNAGKAVCSLEGNEYTLLAARPITAGDQESKIWALHVSNYNPSRAGITWRDGSGSIAAGELSDILRELRVEVSPSVP
jgi:hypothetical protein